MKKFLSMLLTLILVLNIFVGTGIFAFATEGSEECTHTDGGDDFNNVCDSCKEYIGTGELAIGENSVNMTDYAGTKKSLIKFVPAESGLYEFYSTGTDKDPRGYLYDSNISQIAYNDDTNWLPYYLDFGFLAELVEGETYYLGVVSRGMDDMDLVERTVTIAKHTTHTDGNDNYHNLCDMCKSYLLDYDLVPDGNAFTDTLNLYEDKIIRFIPQQTGTYILTATSTEATLKINALSKNLGNVFQEIIKEELQDGYRINTYLYEGETYYFSFETNSSTDIEYTAKLELHVHSGGVETCLGLLCDCGRYYGDTMYDHRLGETQTCMGYQCIDCGWFYGETNDNHVNLSSTQTCSGYQCYDCGKYFGEGIGDHTDGGDYENKRCDVCYIYIGEEVVRFGENTVSLKEGDYMYLSFIPSEDGFYTIYSQSEYDPKIEIYDDVTMGDYSLIGESDDADGRNFILYIELSAGTTYYVGIYEYELDNELTFFVEKHEHISNCLGECVVCGLPLDAVGEHTDGDDEYHGLCDECNEYCAQESTILGENKVSVIEDEYQYVIFVPSESGVYKIYSQSEFDPRIEVYDSDFEKIGVADDENDYNFILYIELEEGKTYYFEFYEYDADNELTYFVEKHEHSTVMTCIGVICEECGELDDSEVDEDAHVWYFGYCVYHEDVAYPEDMECTHDWYFGACSVCGDYYPEEMECTHDWVNGPCKICGIWHGCTEFDDNGVCIVCDYKMYNVVVITNGEKEFFETFEDALEVAVDGSIIKLLNDAWSENVDINQSITIDFNGYLLTAITLYTIDVYAPITLTDSRGGGYCGLGINLYAPAILEGGRYYYIGIEFDTEDTVSDYLAPCAYFADYDDIGDTFANYVTIDLEHNEMQICTGVVCDGCGKEFEGEGDPDVHNFENYELSDDATCVSNAKESSTCEWCNEATDVREIENSKLPHNFKPVYGEGYKQCETCDAIVENVIYSGNAAREVSAAVTRAAANVVYDMLLKATTIIVDEYLDYIFGGIDYLISTLD